MPTKIEHYEPLPNDDCLWCHRGSRRFEGSKHHRTTEAPLAMILDGIAMNRPRVLRLAIALQVIGLAFVPGVLLRTTPGTFLALALAVLGQPLVAIGAGIDLVHVIREHIGRGAL